MLPSLIFEDDDLLAVNKPAGINTHAPGPYSGEGLYDWLRNREPRWARLAIIHRLDKETSGIIVFGKTSSANRSLTEQFTQRTVRKRYVFLTDRFTPQTSFTSKSKLLRAGQKYISRPLRAGGEAAETRFRVLGQLQPGLSAVTPHHPPNSYLNSGSFEISFPPPAHGACYTAWLAEPVTGRTHQIRVHAAEKGVPVLGDILYTGTPAARIYLHAAELTLKHPATDNELTLRARLDFAEDPGVLFRDHLIEPKLTDAFRVVHGASDGWPGWYVDRLGDHLLSQSQTGVGARQHEQLARLAKHFHIRNCYHKVLRQQLRGTLPSEAAPRLIIGEPTSMPFFGRENGLRYELSFAEGYSVGLFLDQRDNRRRLLTGFVAPGFSLYASPSSSASGGREKGIRENKVETPEQPELLNTFAYTCAFSVCAAKAGVRTTNVDLSKKYLDWGKRNFALNQIDDRSHEFVYGDVFDGLQRFRKKGRLFDLVLLDPPTFSQSKHSGVFRAQKDYGKLLRSALPVLKSEGVLFASTNAAGWPAEEFLNCIEAEVRAANRQILQRHFVPQPLDFPISRNEPAYLKTLWLRIK